MGPFASATELCEFTGIPVPIDPARLQSLLGSASELIRGATGQVLSEVANDVVTYIVTDIYALFLPELPVTAISQILVDTVAFTAYTWTAEGELIRTDNALWDGTIQVTYSHGFAETSWEFGIIRTITIQAAARAFTLNERSASEAMGSTLMESAGYAPEVFLTEGERRELSFSPAAVG